MSGVLTLGTLRQETLTSSLATPGERGPPALRSQPGAETVLAFARPFRSLISAFHGGAGSR